MEERRATRRADKDGSRCYTRVSRVQVICAIPFETMASVPLCGGTVYALGYPVIRANLAAVLQTAAANFQVAISACSGSSPWGEALPAA